MRRRVLAAERDRDVPLAFDLSEQAAALEQTAATMEQLAGTAKSAADNALQLHGGNGFALEYPISRVLCDARILNIFEGAAEIQAQVVAAFKEKFPEEYAKLLAEPVVEEEPVDEGKGALYSTAEEAIAKGL